MLRRQVEPDDARLAVEIFDPQRVVIAQVLPSEHVKVGIAGADAFLLHDTYGFPIELTEEIAAGRGVTVDKEGFEKAMDEQRARARAASKFAKDGDEKRAPWTVVSTDADSKFLGYEKLAEDGVVVRRWRERGDQLEVVLDRTPCYAESGGQVSDRGSLRGNARHVYEIIDDDSYSMKIQYSPDAEGWADVLTGIYRRVH
mgnify:CR=1 FL=1